MRTGIANLPLHGGRAPRWLFDRMKRLAREIIIVIVKDFGPEEVLKRLSDPYWFQAFGCVLGFDWHSSGVTTTVCGAIKESIKGLERDLGLFAAGGKGAVSRKTPSEIERAGPFISADPERLVYASRLSAKVDSAALQDGYNIYHHCFFFTREGSWAVVQQGMNEPKGFARRYHWLGEDVDCFVVEPHSAVCCDSKGKALNMVASEAGPARSLVTELSKERPQALLKELERLKTLDMPRRHHTLLEDIHPKRLHTTLLRTYESRPVDFEGLLATPGVGPKTIRALSLVSEIVYGVKNSFRDPVRFSFAHGGKDGHPYPVDRETYDRTIEFLSTALREARIGLSERKDAFRRLSSLR